MQSAFVQVRRLISNLVNCVLSRLIWVVESISVSVWEHVILDLRQTEHPAPRIEICTSVTSSVLVSSMSRTFRLQSLLISKGGEFLV